MGEIMNAGSIIAADNTWALWGILAVIVAVSIFLEQKYKWASSLSAPVLAIIFALIAANVFIIPTASEVYDTAGTYCIPLATAMMLYQANVKNIMRNGGKMLLCMNIGIVATLIGGVVGFFFCKNILPETANYTGAAVASYIGGTANFVAVASSVGLSSDMISVGAFTENFIMTLAIVLLLWMPSSKLFKKWYPHPYQKELEESLGVDDENISMAAKFWSRKEVSLLDISKSVGTALIIVAVATKIAEILGALTAAEVGAGAIAQIPSLVCGNRYVIMTIIALIFVAMFPKYFENLRGAHEIGTFVMYLYFAVIGCTINLHEFVGAIIPGTILYLILAVFNIGILLIVGKLTKQNIEDITIASNACIGGPFTAMAMTTSKGYQKLTVPALLSGIWGNVLGTILGLTLCGILRIF